MALASSLSRQRTPSAQEATLWVLLLLAVYLLSPLLLAGLAGEGVSLSLLPVDGRWEAGALSLVCLGLLGLGGALLGERYLLIEKGERVTMLLTLLALHVAMPLRGATIWLSWLAQWLVLYWQLDTYQDTHQRHAYLLLGGLVGGLSLLHPYFVILLPLVLWGQYYLRALSARSVVALLVGVLLPLWIAVPVLALAGEGLLGRELDRLQAALALATPLGGLLQGGGLLVCYLLALVCYLGSGALYRGRYYRESVRHRDMSLVLLRYPLVLLLVLPLLGWEGRILLPLCFLPLSMLLARGLSGLPARLALLLRTLLWGACLLVYLYQLGLVELLLRLFL